MIKDIIMHRTPISVTRKEPTMKRQPVQFFAYLLLSIVTFGIYPIYYYVKATELQLELLQDILQELKDDS